MDFILFKSPTGTAFTPFGTAGHAYACFLEEQSTGLHSDPIFSVNLSRLLPLLFMLLASQEYSTCSLASKTCPKLKIDMAAAFASKPLCHFANDTLFTKWSAPSLLSLKKMNQWVHVTCRWERGSKSFASSLCFTCISMRVWVNEFSHYSSEPLWWEEYITEWTVDEDENSLI